MKTSEGNQQTKKKGKLQAEEKTNISECRELLGKMAEDLNDQQVEAIRNFYRQLAQITFEQYEREKQTSTKEKNKVIELPAYRKTA